MLFVVCLCFCFLSPFEQNENNSLLLISCFLLFLVFFFDFSLATVIFFWIFSFLFFPPFCLNPRSTHKKTRWINTEPATRWRYFCCMFFFFLVFFKSLFGQLKSKQPFFGSDEEYMNLEFICLCLCMSVYVCNELKLSHLTLEGDVQLLNAEDEGRKNTIFIKWDKNSGFEM